MSSVLLRSVTSEDQTFLQELYVSVRQEEVMSWGWPSEQIQAFLHMQWMAQRSTYAVQFPDASHHVIMLGQESVGQCCVHRSTAYLRLVDISILSAFRNRGIGSTILHNLQLEATRSSIPILLSVAIGNPAHRLYERLGFTITGATDMYVSMQWQPPTNISPMKGASR